jgi:hypothetical protein
MSETSTAVVGGMTAEVPAMAARFMYQTGQLLVEFYK